jgi:tRNA A37 N6-isopentenylltransferase MiaA
MRRRTLAATRQLAKRQLTWLRGWPWMKRLTWGEPAQLAAEIEHQLT